MKGLLMGKEVQQIGLISMDQMLFDISEVPEAQEGDVVTLIGCDPQDGSGAQIHLASWAQMLDTITYELACRLRVRMPRVYTRNLSTQAGK
jgi:alanine racemase